MVIYIMPELPEVETVRNTLKNIIINKKIVSVKVNYNKIIKNVSEEEFTSSLREESFLDIKRKGKYLIFILNNYYLVSHLRMEGKYFLMHDEPLSKHDHIIFYFDDSNLRYNDTRKFGTMHLFSKKEYSFGDIFKVEPLSKIGNEPFDIKEEDLFKMLSKSKSTIKASLLNQKIIAGLGNIYVDEVLFLSRIHPISCSSNLNMEDVRKIKESSVKVLKKAIDLGGTTIHSFESSMGVSGRFQNDLLVHTKSICPVCKNKISKIRVGGRGTYLCEKCQKIK